MADKITPDWRSTVKDRLTVLTVIFACWIVAIVGRLFFLQVISHADLVARADRQQNRTVEVAPSAARSTIATAACWPTALMPTPSTPSPPR